MKKKGAILRTNTFFPPLPPFSLAIRLLFLPSGRAEVHSSNSHAREVD